MKRLLVSVFIVSLLTPSMVLATGSTTTTTTSSTTEQTQTNNESKTCDFSELKKSLNQTESSGKGCDYNKAGYSAKYGYARGKYQFIADTWNSMAKNCAGFSGCPHPGKWVGGDVAFPANCCAVQECAMDNLLASNKAAIAKKATCQKILGKTIQSAKHGSCTVTESGLLAAWHLGGNNACDGPANGTYGDNDNPKNPSKGTYEADYICKHSGKSVQGDCTPSQQGDSNVGGPVGTIEQLETQEAQGEIITVGPADPLKEWWLYGLMLMAEQFTNNMMAQVQAVGMLFDAKHQLETQRLFQEKQARAHKDYHPSEQMCTFGTFARDLAATERSSDLTKIAISQSTLQRELHAGTGKAASGTSDALSRIAQFRNKFCDPSDNADGLKLLCPKSTPEQSRNADINFTTTLDQPMSLKINMMDTETTTDEEAVFALIDNLFMHDPLPILPKDELAKRNYQYHYMNLRSIVAMRGIARNSIANIIAQKTATPNKDDITSAAPFMRALFREFGLQEDEIKKLLGDNPSYYAQMDLLTKKIYQSPGFYNNLYDKPANVERVRSAMTAIKLMQDRDIQASLQRREMLLSMILEIRLRERAQDIYNTTERAMYAR